MSSSSSYPRKRKRSSFSADAQALALVRPVFKPQYKRRRFTPGKSRTGGYYGRFSKAGGELKFFDVSLNSSGSVATSGEVANSINTIAQGTGEKERIGRKCTIRRIHWKCYLSLASQESGSSALSGDMVRCIFYMDKQCNGAAASVTDVLETATWNSFRNLSNSGRFNILYDKTHTINYGGITSEGSGVVTQPYTIKPEITFNKEVNIPLEFSSTTGAISEVRSNNIGVIFISSNDQGIIQSKFRLRFSDN